MWYNKRNLILSLLMLLISLSAFSFYFYDLYLFKKALETGSDTSWMTKEVFKTDIVGIFVSICMYCSSLYFLIIEVKNGK